MKIKKKPLSIYIHIPFCKKKCLYCDFLSAPACMQERENYVKALLREISITLVKVPDDYEVISVFFGGGTPSLLSANQIEQILMAIRQNCFIVADAEITIECNPATADYEKLCSFRESGVNRLSIGLQSANDEELKILGRIHNYAQFLQTYEDARNAGFSNINIDIMSALPGQTYESYLDTLEKVVELAPEHISAYSLIIEEGTPFYEKYGESASDKEFHVVESTECEQEDVQIIDCKQEESFIIDNEQKSRNLESEDLYFPTLPDEETERRMYHQTQSFLQRNGYERYEISNYSKKGYECRHNLTYWTGIDYLGMGIGAASYYQGFRFKNTSDIQKYQEFFDNKGSWVLGLQNCESDREVRREVLAPNFEPGREKEQNLSMSDPVIKEEMTNEMVTVQRNTNIFHFLHEDIQALTVEDKMEEFMFLGLRLKKGISVLEFQNCFQKSIEEVYGKELANLSEQGLLIQDKERIYLSHKGTDVANYVMMQFLL